MDRKRLIAGCVFLAGLMVAGCTAVPMSYAEWQAGLGKRAQFAQAGVPYKSPEQLRGEAAEMRRIAAESPFVPTSR